jgi:DNA-binding winged helix-turn-helix (wHTH) protein/TolB-like protein/Tfp pilus assembly protein PilF
MSNAMPVPDRYAFGSFVLERSQQRVLKSDGTPLALTPRLFDALLLFVERAGELLDKDTLMAALWPGLVVEENNLSQVVHSLRRALGDDGSQFVQTVPRRGFRFIAPVTILQDAMAADRSEPVPVSAPHAETGRSGGPWSRRRQLLALSLGAVAASAGAWWFGRRLAGSASGQTLAVLPFKPLGRDPGDELLGIGMAESLVVRLSLVSGLVVRSTPSAARYRGAAQDPLRAARELDVEWVVDGSLQRHGDRLRATARLLRARDGSSAWSGSFEARAADLFDVQDQIASRLAHELAPALQGDAAARVRQAGAAGGTRSVEAYQLYLTAVWKKQQGSPDAIARSITLLHQALDIDPNFAIAWAELAWSHRYKLWETDTPSSDVFGPANLAIARALAIVPDLPLARSGLAYSHYWYDFDWPAAEREFRTALAANSNEHSAHRGLGLLLATQGRVEEGLRHIRTMRELDPMGPTSNVLEASYLVEAGRLAEAKARLARALDLAPHVWLAHDCRSRLHFAQGEDEAGVAALREAARLGSGFARPTALLAAQLARAGHRTEAQAILHALLEQSQRRYVQPTSLAMVQAALGDTAGALSSLELGLATRDVRMIFLKDDPHWRSLRQEPRFADLMGRMKLAGLPPGLTSV